MDSVKRRWKKISLLQKQLQRLRRPSTRAALPPEGCFAVYVGAERRRFFVRVEKAGHPLFRMLLEDAEQEYGYNSQGPIALPCDVDLFCRVLAAMDDDAADEAGPTGVGVGVAFAVRRRSPFRGDAAKWSCGAGAFVPLKPSPAIKLNQFC